MPYSPLSLLLLLLQVEEAVDIIGGEVRKMFG
jgi:hypothetical protein